jgi:hypothetical protein
MLATLSQAYSRAAREPWEKRNSRPHRDAASPQAEREQFRRGQNVSRVRSEMSDHRDNADTESIGLYVGHTGEPLVGHTGVPLSRAHYSRIPLEVLSDRRLKNSDLRVYAVLAASCWQGSVVSIGKRLIAKRAPCAERLVVPSLKEARSYRARSESSCEARITRFIPSAIGRLRTKATRRRSGNDRYPRW